jgi:phage shock protein C
MTCSGCGSSVGSGARFCSSCGRPVVGDTFGAATSRLVRPLDGRVVAGVCAAFAQAYGWDLIVVRLIFVLAAVFGVGTPVLAYIIAWVVIPNAPVFYPQAYPAYQAPQRAENQPSQPQA